MVTTLTHQCAEAKLRPMPFCSRLGPQHLPVGLPKLPLPPSRFSLTLVVNCWLAFMSFLQRMHFIGRARKRDRGDVC